MSGFTYTAREGDDLFYLADLFYGDSSMWDVIYFANYAALGLDPETIRPAQELLIPDLEIEERTASITEAAAI